MTKAQARHLARNMAEATPSRILFEHHGLQYTGYSLSNLSMQNDVPKLLREIADAIESEDDDD